MLGKAYSAAVQGVDACEVVVEVNTAPGKPAVVVVGLPDTAVKESRDRVSTAVVNSGYRWSYGRTTINLAPADVAKYIDKRERTMLRANHRVWREQSRQSFTRIKPPLPVPTP